MSIRIEEINVRDLGPLKGEHHIPLDTFNLIYGKNERGKTFLVEFLLRSLFRSSKGWRLRDFSADGKVLLSGINGEPTEFSPDSRRKLEDYLEDAQPGLPMDLAKLLVVRGAELSLVEDNLVDRAILKEYLSSEATLDEIQRNISKTIRKAAIEDGHIAGNRQGEIADHRKYSEQLVIIDKLLKEIDEQYSGGDRAGLESRLDDIRGDIATQLKAKRYSAHLLSQEKITLEAQRAKLPDEAIKQAGIDLASYRSKETDVQTRGERVEELESASEGYFWVKNAIAEYGKREARVGVQAGGKFQTLGWISIAVTVLFLVLTILNVPPDLFWPILSLVGVLVSGLFFWLERKQKARAEVHRTDLEELAGTREDFKERFDASMSSLATLEAKREELEGQHYRKEGLQEQQEEDQAAINQLGVQIEAALSKLSRHDVASEVWSGEINELENEARDLDNRIAQLVSDLSRLDVDPSDYVEEDPGVVYQKMILEGSREFENEVEDQLRSATEQLDSLKGRICQETKDEFSTEWDMLVENLRNHREGIADEYRSITSTILGKILVFAELEVLRQQEDLKIQRSLGSPAIVDPLNDITQRYERVSLEDDRLIISDKVRDFPLNDLSTGAQEQVLLALRIGCAAHVLGKQSLFLVLDDAFQHADWDRRERLMDEVIRLGKVGWQILYLTMDDHIRELFQDRGVKEFKDEFRLHDLEA